MGMSTRFTMKPGRSCEMQVSFPRKSASPCAVLYTCTPTPLLVIHPTTDVHALPALRLPVDCAWQHNDPVNACMLRERNTFVRREARGTICEILFYLVATGNAPDELHQWHQYNGVHEVPAEQKGPSLCTHAERIPHSLYGKQMHVRGDGIALPEDKPTQELSIHPIATVVDWG